MKTIKTFLFFTIVLFLIEEVCSQGFTNINANLTGTHFGDVAWGDYNADGYLDIIVTGLDESESGTTKVYKNNGNDSFSELTGLNIPGTYVGDVIWGDYDADMDLDILIQGFTDAAKITALYKNENNNFIESGINFPNLTDGSLSFVDYNNDGLIDIFMAGFDGNSSKSIMFENLGNEIFSEVSLSIPACTKSAYEWADFDKDGDMDVFVCGFDINASLISELFVNNNNVFTESDNSFDGVWLGDASWGDYDNDNDLDLLFSGFSGDRIAKIYKNNDDGSFTEVTSTGLTGVSHSSSIFGDYDNDGDLDVFIAGTYEGSSSWIRVTDVFINNGDDTFSQANLSFSVDAFWGESAWADYDNDGDLDLLCSGYDDLGGSNTIIYRNDINEANTIPTSPENLFADVIENSVTLNWDQSEDNETPSDGLSYNAYIKDESGEIIWNSNSLTETGFQLIPALGNSGQNTNWTINNLQEGNYLWSVQAIDHIYAGSVFSEEQSFEITYVGNHIQSKNEEILCFPNPAHSKVIFLVPVNYNAKEIKIFNMSGQIITTIPIGKSQEVQWIIDGLTPGVYFYEMMKNQSRIREKLVIE